MIILTNSARNTYNCPYRYKLRYVDNLTLAVKKESLWIGGLYASGRELGLDAVYAELDKVLPFDQQEADKTAVQRSMLTGMLLGSETAFEDPPDAEREPEWLNPLINPDSGRASRSIQLAGKADSLIHRNGQSIVVEEKTTGQISEVDIRKLPLDQQVMNEVVNLELSRNIHVSEVWYRYIRKPSIRQKKDETVQQFCDRLEQDYIDRPEFYFLEERLIYDSSQLLEYSRGLWAFGKILLYSINNNYWPRNTSRCSDWGSCEYLPLCSGQDCEGMYIEKAPHEELKGVA